MASLYALALGTNIPLAALNNVENHFGAHNTLTLNGRKFPVGIQSTLIDPFPVRVQAMDGGESGDGFLIQDWLLTLTVYGFKFLVDTYFASETVTQVALTVYTRRHMLDDFRRYNCLGILPSAANGDISPLRESTFNGVARLRLRLRDLLVAV